MDFLMLPAGLALFAFAAVAAGRVAWKRGRRGVGAHGGMDAHGKPPPPLQRKPAHQVAAAAVIEQAQARAAAQVAPVQAAPGPANGPAPQAVTQFDGPGWAATQPMSGVAVEFAFADTMPAGLNAGAPNFADTMPAEMGLAATNFAATNFADTLAVELAAEEPPVAKLGTGRRPA